MRKCINRHFRTPVWAAIGGGGNQSYSLASNGGGGYKNAEGKVNSAFQVFDLGKKVV